MQRCPNCGRATKRTEDWACQWCGYPLLSGSFKKIPKTYKQLEEERLNQLKPSTTEEAEAYPMPEPEREPEPPPVRKPILKPEPVPEPVYKPRPKPKLKPEPKANPKLQPEPEPETEPELKVEPVSEPEPEPVAETELQLVPEPGPPEPEIVVAPEVGTASNPLEVTVKQLDAAYQKDKVAANAKLTKRILKVIGAVDRVVVNDVLDICYIVLTGSEKGLWNVRCTFDKKYGRDLTKLTRGQLVTVQGEYIGYERNILMKDCALVT